MCVWKNDNTEQNGIIFGRIQSLTQSNGSNIQSSVERNFKNTGLFVCRGSKGSKLNISEERIEIDAFAGRAAQPALLLYNIRKKEVFVEVVSDRVSSPFRYKLHCTCFVSVCLPPSIDSAIPESDITRATSINKMK